jgi:hypothetical protein
MSGSKWRVMPNVLTMPTSQVSDPVEAFILMETHDFARNSGLLCSPGFHK